MAIHPRQASPSGGRGSIGLVRSARGPLALLDRVCRAGGVGIPLLLLWIVLALTVPAFLTTVNIENLLLASAAIGVLAFGATIVILTEQIDLSIGALEGLGSVIAAIVIINHGVWWPVGVAAAVLSGLLIGVANGFITTTFRIPSFIVTLGMMGVVNGLALQVTGGQSIYGFPSPYQFIGEGTIFGIRFPVYVAAAVLLGLWALLKFTRLGWHVYATGGSRNASELVGIATRRVTIFAFAVSGACGGLAGVLVSARLNSGSAIFGQDDLLDAIAAVVIGGTSLAGGSGSVIGTAFGVILISTVRNGLNLLNVSPFWQTMAVGAIIITSAMLSQVNRRALLRREIARA